MTQINLLPWRERARLIKNKVFATFCGLIVTVVLIIVLLAKLAIVSQVDSEQYNIDYLNKELKKIESQIKEIDNLQADKEQLLSRRNIVESLQDDRYSIVKLLHDIAISTPQELIINEIKRLNKQVTIKGSASSNASISVFVKNLDQTKWFDNVKITKVELNKSKNLGFVVEFVQLAMES